MTEALPYPLNKGMELIEYVPKEILKIKKGRYLAEVDLKRVNKSFNYSEDKFSKIIDEEGRVVQKFVVWSLCDRSVKYVVNALDTYPLLTEERNDRISLRDVKDMVLDQIDGCISGISGTIKKYFNHDCVLSYATNGFVAYGIFKTKRIYKGFKITTGYKSWVQDIPVSEAIAGMRKIKEFGVKSVELPEGHAKEICARGI